MPQLAVVRSRVFYESWFMFKYLCRLAVSRQESRVSWKRTFYVLSKAHAHSRVTYSIVGRDFLPRGQGIVTRRPLILQLCHTPVPVPSSSSSHPYKSILAHRRSTNDSRSSTRYGRRLNRRRLEWRGRVRALASYRYTSGYTARTCFT